MEYLTVGGKKSKMVFTWLKGVSKAVFFWKIPVGSPFLCFLHLREATRTLWLLVPFLYLQGSSGGMSLFHPAALRVLRLHCHIFSDSPVSLFHYLFIYWLCWVFVAAHGLSVCGEQGLLSSCSAQASHCSGFSCCRASTVG